MSLTRTLTEQLDALRALARDLVRDPEAADDAVQDACVAALRCAAEMPGSVRGWFGRVVQNAARQRARGDQRRRERERLSYELRDVDGGDPDDPGCAVADLALHRRLLQHVSELPARQRAVVTLRFWRGASPREIATILGITPRAVRARQQQALAELRRRLDTESGGRRVWALPLAASLGSDPAGAAPPSPAAALTLLSSWFVMPSKLLAVSGCALAVAIAAAAFVFWNDTDDPGPTPAAERAATRDDPEADASRSPQRPALERAAVEVPASADEATKPAGARMLRGVVADLAGSRLAGVGVVFDPDDAESHTEPVLSDANGSFVLPCPEVAGSVTTADADWATVRRYRHDGGGNPETVFVLVAPARDYAGTVVDPDGVPIAQAVVVIDVPKVGRTRHIDGTAFQLPHDLGMTETDEHGRFVFAHVGWIAGCTLSARRSPFGGAELELPAVSTSNLLVRMSAPPPQDAIYGIVLDAAGKPVADALVAAGALAVRTAHDGTFRAPWRTETPPSLVTAVSREHGAAIAMLRRGPGEPGWDRDNPVVLQLPAEPLRLTGRVVDRDGEPGPRGARVWTPDLTFFGQVVRDVQGHEIFSESSVEEQFGDREMLRVRTVTGADGSFELAGVLARDYALFAIDPRTAVAIGPVFANANAPVELQLAGPELRRVAGRIRTPQGDPLAGVRVQLSRELPWQRPGRSPDPWSGSPMRPPRATSGRLGEGVLTDAEGRFELPPVVVDGGSLRFAGDNLMMPRPFALEPAADHANLEIELPARSAIRVVLESVEAADSFSIVGPDDGHVTVLLRAEGLLLSVPEVEFASGIAPVVLTEARPVTLVLWRDGAAIRRQVVKLRPGGPHEIRL